MGGKRRCVAVATSDNKPHWLAERRQYITASEVAVVLGKSPYKTRLQLFHEKLNGAPNIDNVHTRRGIRHEEDVLRAWGSSPGWAKDRRWKASKTLYASTVYPWLAATPDGLGRHLDKTWVLEAKCPERRWKRPPEHYLWQVRAQMLVLGIHRANLIEGIGPDYSTCEVYPVLLRDEDASLIVELTRAFHRFVREESFPVHAW